MRQQLAVNLRKRPDNAWAWQNESFPASTWPGAASSRASTSSACATPATPSRSRAATTQKAPTSSRSSTSRASIESRGLLYEMIEAVADQVFIPLTVGGGVNTVDDVRALLNAGADKVSINTAGVRNPEFITEASAHFGAQCIVVAIDARKCAVDEWEVYTQGGRTPHRNRRRRMGARGRRAGRRRNPAHEHGPRRRPRAASTCELTRDGHRRRRRCR